MLLILKIHLWAVEFTFSLKLFYTSSPQHKTSMQLSPHAI